MLSACFSCWEITLGGWQRMYSHSFCRRPRDSAILCLLVSCVCLAECNSAEWMADAEVSLVFLTGNGSFSDGEFSVSVCILKLSSFFFIIVISCKCRNISNCSTCNFSNISKHLRLLSVSLWSSDYHHALQSSPVRFCGVVFQSAALSMRETCRDFRNRVYYKLLQKGACS